MISEKERNSQSAKDKKIYRKQKRLQCMLVADSGVIISERAAKNVAVCNAGVATGLDEEELLRICQQYGDIERIVMIPGKSYCFLVFHDETSAYQMYTNVNGATKLAQGGHPLYLSFVSNVPLLDEDVCNVLEAPRGLQVCQNLLTIEEEAVLLSLVNWDGNVSNSMKHRRVKHYGYEFMYTNNNIDLNKPLDEKIPEECNFLWERLKSIGIVIDSPPNQLTVNQYNPGQGIPSHVDTHSAFLSPILSLSLGADVMMDFKLGHQKYSVLLPARSLLVMDDSSRYEWSHGIAPRSYDVVDGRTRLRGQRTSFTFRWVRPDAKCNCKFPSQCDTAAMESNFKGSDIDDYTASLVERHHVHEVYDQIASHFSETRSKIWTSVKQFIDFLDPGTFMVDVGCGNGKNLRIRNDIIQLGIEYNGALAELARHGENLVNTKVQGIKFEVLRGDCLTLPLRSQSADAVISIAVFHHLATQKRRVQAISEVMRILKPGGHALITVWARDQARGEKTSYLKQNRKNRKQDEDITESLDVATEEIKDSFGNSLNLNLPVHTNRNQFQHQDLLVPWKLKNQKDNDVSGDDKESTFMRYYHVFDEGELETICRSVPDTNIMKNFYEQGNWCVILEKSLS